VFSFGGQFGGAGVDALGGGHVSFFEISRGEVIQRQREPGLVAGFACQVGRRLIVGDGLGVVASTVMDVADIIQPAVEIVVLHLAGLGGGGGKGS